MSTAQQHVFVNRLLNLKKIDYLGLDMDHTLIRYNTEAFESLTYDLVIEQLITNKGYPQRLRQLNFDFNASIRGLVIDCHQGNILKLSRHGAIRKSYHGTKEINFAKQSALYRNQYIDLNDANYLVIDTAFSIAFCGLYTQLVDCKDQSPLDFPSYAEITNDLLECHDKVHRDGSLKSRVKQQLEQFIIQDEAVVKGLLRFKQHNKKIIIITNSEYDYTKALLDYAISPFLAANQSWLDLFDYVITLADKPRFFYDNLKFLRINPSDGSMVNVEGEFPPGIYQGGCADKLSQYLNLEGDNILYIGDHIYGDVVKLKKICNWRTALVVEEIEREVTIIRQNQSLLEQIKQLMTQKIPLENRVTDLISLKIENNAQDNDDEQHQLQQKISELDDKISPLIQQYQAKFNPWWGPVFRAGAEESFFAYQVDRFACIYMDKLSHLFDYSPRHYFRAQPRPLAHEL